MHICWCLHLEDGSRRCRGAVHKCICGTDGGLNCGAKDHECVCCYKPEANECACDYYAVAEAAGIPPQPHDCVWAKRGAELCRYAAPARFHKCTCAPDHWRSCRRWGGHDDPLVEARGVRALVVASHGSAPNAEISTPILRGFAGLPHQLRLCVAEIAWVMAAADAKNDK